MLQRGLFAGVFNLQVTPFFACIIILIVFLYHCFYYYYYYTSSPGGTRYRREAKFEKKKKKIPIRAYIYAYIYIFELIYRYIGRPAGISNRKPLHSALAVTFVIMVGRIKHPFRRRDRVWPRSAEDDDVELFLVGTETVEFFFDLTLYNILISYIYNA